METIRKTESKIGKNDEPSHILKQMPRPRASSTRLNNKNPSSFQEVVESNKKIRAGINPRLNSEQPLEETSTLVRKKSGNNNKDSVTMLKK